MAGIFIRQQPQTIFAKQAEKVVCLFILWVVLPAGFVYPGSRLITDHDIIVAIEERLSQNDHVQETLIDVDAQTGIVTLAGETDNLLAKERAAKLAGTIKGVRSVVNRIVVNPWVGQKDQDIERQVKTVLLDNPATELYDMNVRVTKGVVTLTGVVQSGQEKQLAISVAKGIKGVRGIQDNLTIKTIGQRSDTAMKKEIVQRLNHDVWVNSEPIGVEVKNGIVTLSGTVSSVEQQSRAELLSWVHGITEVKGRQLKVEWSPQKPMHRSGFHIPPDHQIQEAVSDALSLDPRVPRDDITIEVNEGLVTLTGAVDQLHTKQFAEEDARQTAGVYNVVNHVKVRNNPRVSDEAIAQRVRRTFFRDPFLDRSDINVNVHHHTIYLRGTVNSRLQRQRAEILAAAIPGAVQVNNQLTYPRAWITESDFELREDIQEQLWWSPFLSDHSITVRVENGVATLNGTVGTWQQRHRAEEHALAAGARKVNNDLQLLTLNEFPSAPDKNSETNLSAFR